MSLVFIGVDPPTPEGGSPTVWIDPDTLELVLQGWTADGETVAACRTYGPVPAHETIHRMPDRMIPFLRKACDELEQRQRERGVGGADASADPADQAGLTHP